ncbi:MAG: TPM domain-containing protein [Ignavibacteria bacterium]|nr:TPM domain-containing protein [Ignavibacteria bacterium]
MSKKNFISEYLSDDALDKIAKSIGEIEKKTSGEIRVCIKKNRGYFEKKHSPRETALKEFFKLKMHDTRDRTGVLFFLILSEHKFEIIADEGINNKISQEKWDVFSRNITDHFSLGNYAEGILYGIEKIGAVLTSEFPVKHDDKDELSNEVIIK